MNMDLWKKCVEFHGHECPGLAMGYRAAVEASEYFKNMRSVMKHNSEVKIETKTKIVQSAFVVPKKSNIDIGSL